MHDQGRTKRSSRLRRHIRSNLVGYLALAVALSMAPAWAGHLNVKTSDIRNRAVTTPKLRNFAVGPRKIKAGAVRTGKIRDEAVTGAKIAEAAVGSDQLGGLAVTTIKLANGAVTTTKLGNGSVTTVKLDNGSVTAAKLANDLRPRWAVVRGSDGVRVRQRGTTSSARLGTGAYQVVFDRDVTSCAYIAQIGGITTDIGVGQASATRLGGNSNGVLISTRNSSGDSADRSFHLLVLC